jgi:hypothetical protein
MQMRIVTHPTVDNLLSQKNVNSRFWLVFLFVLLCDKTFTILTYKCKDDVAGKITMLCDGFWQQNFRGQQSQQKSDF